MECIFGIHWTIAQVRPWILETVELISPIRRSASGAYFDISEKRRMLYDAAAAIYGA